MIQREMNLQFIGILQSSQLLETNSLLVGTLLFSDSSILPLFSCNTATTSQKPPEKLAFLGQKR